MLCFFFSVNDAKGKKKVLGSNQKLKFNPTELILYCKDLRIIRFCFDEAGPESAKKVSNTSLQMVPLLLSPYVIPLRYYWATSLGFPCLSLLMTTLFLPWLREFATYKHSVSVLSPLPQQRDIYCISYKLWCAALWTSLSEHRSLTFQKAFAVWPFAKQWMGHIENNAHWRQRKQNDPDCWNNWQCDSDSSPAQIGQIVHSLNQSSGRGPLVQYYISTVVFVRI